MTMDKAGLEQAGAENAGLENAGSQRPPVAADGLDVATEGMEVASADGTVVPGPQPAVPDELEVMLCFELDRLSVPLAELSAWSTGATVALERKPEDPVRILLAHAGGSRLIGQGRVVIVEDRVGIRIEDWRPGERR